MSKLETNTIDTVSGTANLTIGGANNTGSTTIKTNNTDAVTIDNSQNLQFNSGYGSVATAYGVRAWVYYAGRNSVGIRNSGNVSSVTDNGTGDYTINFTNPMPDINYSIASANATYNLGITDYRWISFVDSVSTTSFTVQTNLVQNGAGVTDSEYVNHVVFR